jgi:hypothetical protein
MPFSRTTYATVLVITGVIIIGGWAFAQNPATITEQLTTAERIERSKWWPTGGRAGKNEYVGSRACEQCHYAIVKSQSRHSMAKASVPAEISDPWATRPVEVFGWAITSIRLFVERMARSNTRPRTPARLSPYR